MKRAILVLGVVCLLAGPALALSDSLGGYVYYDRRSNQSAGSTYPLEIWRIEVDADWTLLSETNTDNVAFSANNTYGWQSDYEGWQVEVWDPRDKGGTGKVLVSTIYDGSPPGDLWYAQPWDQVMVSPGGGAQTVIDEGEVTETLRPYKQVRIPNDTWMPGTNANGLGYVCLRNPSTRLYYFYDQNNNGEIDNDGSESTSVCNPTFTDTKDMEFGDDDCLYVSARVTAGWPNSYATISRIWIDGTGNAHSTGYWDPANMGLETGRGVLMSDGMGIAVGPTPSNPIVYVGVKDNVTDGTATGRIYRDAIFAVQDIDGDNLITAGSTDIITRLWYGGKPGSNVGPRFHQSTGIGYIEDLEYWEDPDNSEAKFLFVNGYGPKLAVFQLDNTGLAVADDMWISTTLAMNGSDGFELDMNPIPEPTTLLLLGTGALGVVGYIRRRRMT